jgi:hypothetical protein
LPVWRSIDDVARLADCLDALGALAAAQCREALAAQCWSAAQTCRDANGVSRLSTEQALHDRAVASARDRCDEATWLAAWAAGERLPVEQVVARYAGSS